MTGQTGGQMRKTKRGVRMEREGGVLPRKNKGGAR